MDDNLEIITFPAGPLACNCSIVADRARREAVVIDPGGDEARILQLLRERDFEVKALLHTHAHLDHLGATGPVREATQAPVWLHGADRFLWDIVPLQANFLGMTPFTPPPIDEELEQGQELAIGSLRLRIDHTPGHSPGSVCFRLHGGSREPLHVFSGDTLFRGSIGRTDLWGGDFNSLIASIHDRLLGLADATPVTPGHGPRTTIGFERGQNPFLQ